MVRLYDFQSNMYIYIYIHVYIYIYIYMASQLPPWGLLNFVLLDFKPSVTPEGFEPSQNELDPG